MGWGSAQGDGVPSSLPGRESGRSFMHKCSLRTAPGLQSLRPADLPLPWRLLGSSGCLLSGRFVEAVCAGQRRRWWRFQAACSLAPEAGRPTHPSRALNPQLTERNENHSLVAMATSHLP